MVDAVPCFGKPKTATCVFITNVPFTTAADAADVDPPLTYDAFVTVSTTRRNFPTSPATGVYALFVAPEIFAQLARVVLVAPHPLIRAGRRRRRVRSAGHRGHGPDGRRPVDRHRRVRREDANDRDGARGRAASVVAGLGNRLDDPERRADVSGYRRVRRVRRATDVRAVRAGRVAQSPLIALAGRRRRIGPGSERGCRALGRRPVDRHGRRRREARVDHDAGSPQRSNRRCCSPTSTPSPRRGGSSRHRSRPACTSNSSRRRCSRSLLACHCCHTTATDTSWTPAPACSSRPSASSPQRRSACRSPTPQCSSRSCRSPRARLPWTSNCRCCSRSS